MALPSNVVDREQAKFKEDKNSNVAVNVCDVETHDKLDDVISALGGSTDTATTIANVSAPTANTEVSYALPANTKSFRIRARGRSRIQLAYNSGESGTTYITIMPGNTYINNQKYTSQTLYFQCSKGSETVEIQADVNQ